MRLIHLNEFNVNRESILFMNGGGQMPFSKQNKLVKYFKKFDYNTIAVELPGHGKSFFLDPMSKHEFISHFQEEFRKMINEEKILIHALIGFSLGGLLALKAIEMNIVNANYVITFGCGFGIDEAEKDTFNYYTSEKFFRDMNWEPIMKRNHGKGWYNLLLSIDELMHVESPIFTNPKKIGDDTEILIILGDNEELFTPTYTKKMISLNQYNSIYLEIVYDTSHFEYTSKSWEKFKEGLNQFIEKYKWFS